MTVDGLENLSSEYQSNMRRHASKESYFGVKSVSRSPKKSAKK
jgi:hypothetical protein